MTSLTPLTIVNNFAVQSQSMPTLPAANAADKAAFDRAMNAGQAEVEAPTAISHSAPTSAQKGIMLSDLTPEQRKLFDKMIVRYIVDTAIDNAMNPMFPDEEESW